MKCPESAIEWQEAVNSAYVLRLINASPFYRLITDGSEISAAACNEMLMRGRALGYKPDSNTVEDALHVVNLCF